MRFGSATCTLDRGGFEVGVPQQCLRRARDAGGGLELSFAPDRCGAQSWPSTSQFCLRIGSRRLRSYKPLRAGMHTVEAPR